MPTRYPIPAADHEAELEIKRSRFISYASYTPTVEEAKAYVKMVRALHPTANHVVYAFAVGHGATVTHGMSDDGEPSNTAGRPTLAVVKGSNIGDLTVATVRYFGGTKLGTGGLVKAYTESAQLVLADLPLTEKVERRVVELTIPYHYYEQCKRLIAQHSGTIDDEQFAAEITLTLSFIEDDLPPFEADFIEAMHGQRQIIRLESRIEY